MPIATTQSPMRGSLLGELDEGIIAGLASIFSSARSVFGVGADHLGVQRLAVVHRHGDGLGVLDDVVVGDDIAVGRDEEAGAERHVVRGACIWSGRAVLSAEPLEELLNVGRKIVHLRRRDRRNWPRRPRCSP